MTAEQRTMRARAGGFARAARHSPAELTGAARVGFERRFLRLVDPDELLDPAERQRRAGAALRQHMTTLALASSRARAIR